MTRVSLPSATMVPAPVGVKKPPMPAPPGADALGEGPLRVQLDLDGAGQVLLGQIGVAADEAADDLARPGGSCSSTARPWPWLPQLLLMMVRSLGAAAGDLLDAGLGVARTGRNRPT